MYVCSVASAVSDSLQPYGLQPAGLLCSWDSPGKNIGVGCHASSRGSSQLRESEVTQSCPTLSDPVDCSLPGSSVHGIFQARVLEWDATSSFMSPALAARFLTTSATWEAPIHTHIDRIIKVLLYHDVK